MAKNGGGISIISLLNINPIMNKIVNCTFSSNKALQGNGGAIFLDKISNPFLILNSNFFVNFAAISGGGIGGVYV